MKRKDILKDAVSYIFKTMMKDNNSVKKWRIKILSICLSAILLVSIIITTVCVSVIHKENVVFTELKLPEEKTLQEYNAEIYRKELEIERLAGKQYYAIKASIEKAQHLKQQAQRSKENAELLKQQSLEAQHEAEKAQKDAQEAEKRAQIAREEADQKLKEANNIRIEKLEIQNMISKKMVQLSNTSIVDEKSITPSEIKQNIDNDYTVSNQVKEKSKKVANFLAENNISYDKISNYEKNQLQKELLRKIKNQTGGKIEQIENWNAQTQEEKEAKAYYMSKHLDANILREKFPNMIGRASDTNKLTDDNVGSFDYAHRYNRLFPWMQRNSDDDKPYTYNSITSYSSSSLERCGIDNNYVAIGKKMSDLKLMIGDWPWIDDTINVFMNNCEVLEYVTLNKIQHETQSLSESDIEYLIKKEINDSEYKDVFSWLLGSEGINSIVKDVKNSGINISAKYLVGLFLSAGGNKLLSKYIPEFIMKTVRKYGKIDVGTLENAGKYLLAEVITDIISSFSSNVYKKIKLTEIENSSAQVLWRLNSTFNVSINSEMYRRTIKAAGAAMQTEIFLASTPFSAIFLMLSVINLLKQIFLMPKMTYTIKPALDMFMELLKRNPEQYSLSMYEKTKNWKTGIWYLIKTNSIQRIQNIDMEPRYQLGYLKDTSGISDEEKAKSEQEGKSQLRECGWFESLWKWTTLPNCQ